MVSMGLHPICSFYYNRGFKSQLVSPAQAICVTSTQNFPQKLQTSVVSNLKEETVAFIAPNIVNLRNTLCLCIALGLPKIVPMSRSAHEYNTALQYRTLSLRRSCTKLSKNYTPSNSRHVVDAESELDNSFT
jgi:hypothetical protein